MRLACIQAPVQFNNPEGNFAYLEEKVRELRSRGVELAVFPEAFLTGYCVDCLADADALGIARTDAMFARLQGLAEEVDMVIVVGFAERASDGRNRNVAVLVEPGREQRFYEKTHLPELGLDKFVEAGRDLPVFDTRLGKIGILICYDLRPPEAMRVLAIKGAELVLLPTNWPVGAETSAEHISIARAAENRIFVATCDRVGEENGFRFIGLSKIISPTGKVLASAGAEEAVLLADIDLAEARQKRTVNIPGKYELEVFKCRQPNLYEVLSRTEDEPARH